MIVVNEDGDTLTKTTNYNNNFTTKASTTKRDIKTLIKKSDIIISISSVY